MQQNNEVDTELERVLQESAEQFALEEQIREFRLSAPEKGLNSNNSNNVQDRELDIAITEVDDVDEDAALKLALEISREEFDESLIEDFTEEEILKISEIESNQDNNFTIISCLRKDALDECIFCLEIPVRLEVVRRLRCMHIFHKDCFDEYFDPENNQKNVCPICEEAVIENNC